MPSVRKVLVANRGEIARRVMRTRARDGSRQRRRLLRRRRRRAARGRRRRGRAHRAGAEPRVVPRDRSHPRRGARAPAPTRSIPATASSPRTPTSRARCAEAGLTFIGPPVDAIRAHGQQDRGEAHHGRGRRAGGPGRRRRRARRRGAVARGASGIGFPLLVKASAGGGGKGMRIVRDAGGAARARSAAARREAPARVRRRHAAARALRRGAAPHRDPDLRRHARQRRAPASSASARSSAATRRSSRRRRRRRSTPTCARAWATPRSPPARAIGYVGAGTVEFIVDRGRRVLLPRGEHAAAGRASGDRGGHRARPGAPADPRRARASRCRFAQARRARSRATRSRRGSTPRTRARDFLPATGTRRAVGAAGAAGRALRQRRRGRHRGRRPLRPDARQGDRARADARRGDRRGSRARSRDSASPGVTTNRDFLLAVLDHPAFAAGDARHALHRAPPAGRARARPRATPRRDRVHAIAAALWRARAAPRAPAARCPPSIPSGWRNNRWRPQDVGVPHRRRAARGALRRASRTGASTVEVRRRRQRAPRASTPATRRSRSRSTACAGASRSRRPTTRICVHGPLGTAELREVPRFPPRAARGRGGRLPRADDRHRPRRCASRSATASTKGAVLLVLEAMKMEHQMVAHAAGVGAARCASRSARWSTRTTCWSWSSRRSAERRRSA